MESNIWPKTCRQVLTVVSGLHCKADICWIGWRLSLLVGRLVLVESKVALIKSILCSEVSMDFLWLMWRPRNWNSVNALDIADWTSWGNQTLQSQLSKYGNTDIPH